jgi:Uma2 family endonuclease
MAINIPNPVNTVADWQTFVERPEHADRHFELIHGEIVEKMPSSTRNSGVAAEVSYLVMQYCRTNEIPCYVTVGDGTYLVDGHIIVPDFTYKASRLTFDYPDPTAPLFAIEVISPSETATSIRTKRAIYLQAGILYWEIYPEDQVVEVWEPGKPMRSVNATGTLDGDGVLPGFSFPAGELWQNISP